jgi:hypothetical protein
MAVTAPVRIDFTNVKTGSDPVSEGRHLVALYDAKWGETKKGDPMLKVTWKCQAGDPDEGRQVFDQYPVMPTTMWKLKLLLEGLGEDASGEYEFDAQGLVGKIAVIEVEHEEYDGKNRARVKAVYPNEDNTASTSAATGKGRKSSTPF